MRENIIQSILDNKIIAIVRGADPDQAVLAASAVFKGGIKLIEVTFNQKSPESFIDTVSAIRAIKENVPEMIVGAGTVLTVEQVGLATDGAADLILTVLKSVRRAGEMEGSTNWSNVYVKVSDDTTKLMGVISRNMPNKPGILNAANLVIEYTPTDESAYTNYNSSRYGVLFGGIYDDRLLIKPTEKAKALLPNAEYAIPYDGAKPMIFCDFVDDSGQLTDFIKELTNK